MSHSQREEKGGKLRNGRIFGGKKKTPQSTRKPFGKQNHDNRNATPGTREQKAKTPPRQQSRRMTGNQRGNHELPKGEGLRENIK